MQLELTAVSKGHRQGWLLYEARRGSELLFKLCAPPGLAAQIAGNLDKNFAAKSLIQQVDSESSALLSRQGGKE